MGQATRAASSLRQLFQQCPRLLQIARVETFSEPAVDRSEQFARLLHFTLVAPEACEAHGGAELLPGFGLLLVCDRERTVEIALCLCSVGAPGDFSAISPAVRLTSASHHLSLVVSTAVVASTMHRQASSSWPSSP